MKRILFIIFTIVSLFIIKNLVVSIYSLWQKQDLVTQAQKELSREQDKNRDLKHKLKIAQSPLFIEQQARNKLFLVKPLEQEVLIPKSLLAQKNEAGKQVVKPNWEQWVELFF